MANYNKFTTEYRTEPDSTDISGIGDIKIRNIVAGFDKKSRMFSLEFDAMGSQGDWNDGKDNFEAAFEEPTDSTHPYVQVKAKSGDGLDTILDNEFMRVELVGLSSTWKRYKQTWDAGTKAYSQSFWKPLKDLGKGRLQLTLKHEEIDTFVYKYKTFDGPVVAIDLDPVEHHVTFHHPAALIAETALASPLPDFVFSITDLPSAQVIVPKIRVNGGEETPSGQLELQFEDGTESSITQNSTLFHNNILITDMDIDWNDTLMQYSYFKKIKRLRIDKNASNELTVGKNTWTLDLGCIAYNDT
tara:strand:- start:317 stop:1219 length:903 start_codon:yes stop_codon:yes gene_type:complete